MECLRSVKLLLANRPKPSSAHVRASLFLAEIVKRRSPENIIAKRQSSFFEVGLGRGVFETLMSIGMQVVMKKMSMRECRSSLNDNTWLTDSNINILQFEPFQIDGTPLS